MDLEKVSIVLHLSESEDAIVCKYLMVNCELIGNIN